VDTEPGAYSGNNSKSMRMTAADDADPRLLRLLMAAHRHSSTEIFEWDQGDRSCTVDHSTRLFFHCTMLIYQHKS
jgi:hypothetical protein